MTNTDYQNYQLQWMRDHAYSLEHLMMSLEKYRQNTFGLTIPELFEEWEFNQGFDGEIWVCEDEFNDCEAQGNQKQDVACIRFTCAPDLSEWEQNQGFNGEILDCKDEFEDCEMQKNQKQDVVCTRFDCDSDLSKYTDSMLFDSDTETIAEGIFKKTLDGRGELRIVLCVRGAVRVETDGEIFTSPSEFPAWLKERIRKHPNGWQYLDTDDREIYCHDTNWFELLVTSERGYCGGYVYESDLSKDTPEDVYQTMFEIARDYFTA